MKADYTFLSTSAQLLGDLSELLVPLGGPGILCRNDNMHHTCMEQVANLRNHLTCMHYTV